MWSLLGSANQTQKLLGFEKVLADAIWTNVSRHLKQSLPIERGMESFLDAVSDYMAFLDNDCVFNLCLAFEICENKYRLMAGEPRKSKNKDLLRDSNLVEGELKTVLRKIITDRDNIAHGREPHNLSKNPDLITEYLDAGFQLINLYLDRCNSFGWPTTLKTSLDPKNTGGSA